MRNFLSAMLIAAPIAANAQTPRDLAHLAWGAASPAPFVSAPNRAGFSAAGRASAADLANLTWPRGLPLIHGTAPRNGRDLATGGTGRDLARLLGPSGNPAPAGMLLAGAGRVQN